HFVLTDVPMTALVTLAMVLALRAARVRTVRAYAWAGLATGLSAGAKYNGAVVAVAVAIAWIAHERSAPDRWRKALAAAAAPVGGFIAAVPYALLDWRIFASDLQVVMTRFSPEGRTVDDPQWRSYLTHLSLAGSFWLPMALLGVLVVLWRHRSLDRWAIPIG